MKKLLFLIVYMPLLVVAQSNENGFSDIGIKFVQNMSWQQLKNKAMVEQKFIFVDCFTTWCGSCKYMDNEVFPHRTVGLRMNSKFLSVKVQMDTAKQDNPETKKWYNDADMLRAEYNVVSFPTYLFFSPDGKIVHRYLGAMSDSLFLIVTENALNPKKQYYTLLSDYLQGRKDYNEMRYLANTAMEIGNLAEARLIGRDYIDNYLNRTVEEELYLRKNLDFINHFSDLLSTKDRVFWFVYNNGDKVDDIIKIEGFARAFVDNIIEKEEIDARIWSSNGLAGETAPNWRDFIDKISKKYSIGHAERTVLNAQLRWYSEKSNWEQLIKCYVKKVDRYGLDTAGVGKVLINNFVWQVIFKHSNNGVVINKAIKWMEVLLRMDPCNQDNCDTYANLLYKVGRRKDAIHWEERALKIAKEKNDEGQIRMFQEIIAKMRKGQPTWVAM